MNTSTVDIRSNREDCFTADMTPMGMAIIRIRAMERTFIPRVMVTRSNILSLTDLPSTKGAL